MGPDGFDRVEHGDVGDQVPAAQHRVDPADLGIELHQVGRRERLETVVAGERVDAAELLSMQRAADLVDRDLHDGAGIAFAAVTLRMVARLAHRHRVAAQLAGAGDQLAAVDRHLGRQAGQHIDARRGQLPGAGHEIAVERHMAQQRFLRQQMPARTQAVGVAPLPDAAEVVRRDLLADQLPEPIPHQRSARSVGVQQRQSRQQRFTPSRLVVGCQRGRPRQRAVGHRPHEIGHQRRLVGKRADEYSP